MSETTAELARRCGRTHAPGGTRRRGLLGIALLRRQNEVFSGSGGVSANNRGTGFVPGFCDTRTGAAVISRFANGEPAPVHVLDGLPDAWVSQRDAQGHVVCARGGIVAGFLREGHFYTREQAARLCAA